VNSIYLYFLALLFLLISYLKDRQKTKMALFKAWKSFSNLIPEIISVMMFAGIILAILNPNTISKLIGAESGFSGILLSLIAGYAQIAAFVSSLIAVGIVTLPLEIKYFNKHIAILRNAFALIVSFIFTMVIWKLI
jgi:ABC-type uncharacterized transport system fused permease/ATPase subunit